MCWLFYAHNNCGGGVATRFCGIRASFRTLAMRDHRRVSVVARVSWPQLAEIKSSANSLGQVVSGPSAKVEMGARSDEN
jgi:hypothetical protein